MNISTCLCICTHTQTDTLSRIRSLPRQPWLRTSLDEVTQNMSESHGLHEVANLKCRGAAGNCYSGTALRTPKSYGPTSWEVKNQKDSTGLSHPEPYRCYARERGWGVTQTCVRGSSLAWQISDLNAAVTP